MIDKNKTEILHNIDDANKQFIFDQYKLYVEMADKISDRRHITNGFYLTLNTLFTPLAISSRENIFVCIGISLIGFIISLLWYSNIKSYRQLNEAKFDIIHELEDFLPFRMYKYEWRILQVKKTYKPFSAVEKYIPLIFLICYAILLVAIFVIKVIWRK